MELNFETVTPTCNISPTLLDEAGYIHLSCSDERIRQIIVTKLEQIKYEIGITNVNDYVNRIVSLTINPTYNINDVAKSLYNGFSEHDNLSVVIRDYLNKDITDKIIN